MKQDAEYFADRDAELVYIARRMSDATQLERIFTEAGMEYGVEADTYTGGIIFRAERVGAFFYVLAEVAETARKLMKSHGFRPHA